MKINFQSQKLAESWILGRIGNRVKINYGKSQASIRSADGNVPIYGTGGLIGFGNKWLSRGDSVVIGRKGTLDNPIYIVCPFWAVDTTYYTSDFDGSSKWFFYLVQTLGLASLNEATGVPSLARETFYRLEVPFPPRQQQEKIAQVLSTVDRAIEQTEALIAKYERIKTGLMQDLLTRGIDEHGRLRDPGTHKFKPSMVGTIPQEWRVSTLGESCQLIKDGTHLPPRRVSEGPLLLGVQNIINGNLQRTASDTRVSWDFYYKMHRNWLIEPSDVLLAIVGATIGKVCHVPANFEPFTLQRSVALLRGKDGFLVNDYLLHYLNSPLFQRVIHLRTNSTAQAGLYLSQIAKFLIPICPLEEQRVISHLLSNAQQAVRAHQRELVKLQRLKTGLMQDLLTGKVSVEPLLKPETVEVQTP